MNEAIKEYAARKKVLLWQVADRLGVVDTTLSRWLRHPLSKEKQELFLTAVEKIAAEREGKHNDE